jgi:hypothetical protein
MIRGENLGDLPQELEDPRALHYGKQGLPDSGRPPSDSKRLRAHIHSQIGARRGLAGHGWAGHGKARWRGESLSFTLTAPKIK